MPGFLAREIGSFWQGLVSTTRGSLLASLAVALLEFGAAARYVTPANIAHLPSNAFKIKDADDFARITVDAIRLKNDPPDTLQVAYLGTSVARLAMQDTDYPDRMSAALTTRVGAPVTFWNFAANNEQVEEYLILLDYFPDDYRGVVVAMVTDNRHGHVEHVDGHRRFRRKERLGLDAATLGINQALLGEAQDANTGIYFIDHLGFFAARRIVGVLGEGPGPEPTPVGHTPDHSWVRARAELDADLLNPLALDDELQQIERFARTLRRRHIPTILLEGPSNPRFDEMKGEWKPEYRKRIEAVAERSGAFYWDISDEVGITTADFLDTMHLGNSVIRRRFQGTLLDHVATLLRRRFLDEPSPNDGPKSNLESPPRRVAPVDSLRR